MIIKSAISTKTNKTYVAIFNGDKVVCLDYKTINELIDMYALNLGLHPKIVYTRVYTGELAIEFNFNERS